MSARVRPEFGRGDRELASDRGGTRAGRTRDGDGPVHVHVVRAKVEGDEELEQERVLGERHGEEREQTRGRTPEGDKEEGGGG